MQLGRNDPCNCGSGKKYKSCCLGKEEIRPTAPKSAEIEHIVTLFNAGKHDILESKIRSLIEIFPNLGIAWMIWGVSLQIQGRDGLPALEKAAKLLPNDIEAQQNLLVAQRNMGENEGALVSVRRVLKLNPKFAEAHNDMGFILHELGRLSEAESSYLQALKLEPNFAAAHSNLSRCLLAMGRLTAGWPKYEYRWDGTIPKLDRPVTTLPQWKGQNVSPSDRLLVFAEQGWGDQLQFSRYLQLTQEKFIAGVSIVVEAPLRELFQRSFPNVEILKSVPRNQKHWQWQCPLLSLPLAFNTSLNTIPRHIPYLIPDPVKVTRWESKIAALNLPASSCKIGLVWKTSSLMSNTSLRSLTLQKLEPILNGQNCIWFSLQKEPHPSESAWKASGKLIDWSKDFDDFDWTAALVMNMDLVISVDTAVAHLAGGLGVPIWLLNRYASEWRWMRDRVDSPWYPSMKIFTQKTAGDWDGLVKEIANSPEFSRIEKV